MLNKYFSNYEEFKTIFQVSPSLPFSPSNRRQKVFLSSLKYAIKNNRRENFEESINFIDSTSVVKYVREVLRQKWTNNSYLLNFPLPCDMFTLDEMKGICEDGDIYSIRYVKSIDGVSKVYKMKAGKLMRKILNEKGITDIVGQAAADYYCEYFSNLWTDENKKNLYNCTLKIDDDFEFIYNSENYYKGDFGSCMSDDGYYSFYNCCDASAASIVNSDGLILARCVVYNKVKGLQDIIRLAERQYSSEGKDFYKRLLINKLIEGKHIDGYKQIGAGCGDSTAFVWNNGELLRDSLNIDLSLDFGDSVSYQDSFKYYMMGEGIAYNTYKNGCVMLDITNGELEGNWDEYNEEYTSDEITYVQVWRRRGYEDVAVSQDYANNNFTYYNGQYYDECEYSEILGEDVPSMLLDEIEEQYKIDNWNWDEYNEEYTEENTILVHIWKSSRNSYDEQYCSESYAADNFTLIDGEYYDEIDENGQPLAA